MKFKVNTFLGLVVCFLGLCFLASPLFAQSYPTKAVTFVVPWPPGGRTDLTARIVAQFLAEPLGQPVVVVNKAGASGVAGAKEVTMARPDGYTLGFFSTGVVTTQYTVPTPTDLKDYEPISFINMDPAALAVNANSPFKTLEDLVSYAKKNPEKLNFGIAPGSSNHIMTAIFAKAAGLKLYFVPFKGGGERSVALAGKHIDADMDVPAIYKSLVEAGKVRILGVASEKRVSLYKELPTFREQGVDCVTGSWHGVFAPKGTPKEVLSIVEKALEKTSKNPNFVEVMHKANIGVHYMNREEFIRFLEKEDVRIKEIVKELDIK